VVFGKYELSPLLRTLIPDSAWHDMPDERGRAGARCVTTDELRAMSEQFLPVHDVLHEMTRG
jgi:hypothetical protein